MTVTELRELPEQVTIERERYEELKSLMRSLNHWFSHNSHDELLKPFSSARDRMRQYVDSARHPKSYYNFTAFGVRICVHFISGFSYKPLEIERGDYYFTAVCGYETKSKAFTLCNERFYVQKFNFYNPRVEFEQSVVDFYLLVFDFLSSIGLGRTGSLDF